MPRSGLSESEIENFRTRICDAAARLFTLHGYDGVTLRALARELGCALGARLVDEKLDGDTALVSVPLHPRRRLERGYDQAALLAAAAAGRTGLTVVRALARVRDTTPQGAPGARSRRANVRGAFRARRRAVQGRSNSSRRRCASSGQPAGASSSERR